MSSNRKFWVGALLFAMLGAALSAIGINFKDNPISFMTIIGISVLIDLNASWK
jgi:hypothetical protein